MVESVLPVGARAFGGIVTRSVKRLNRQAALMTAYLLASCGSEVPETGVDIDHPSPAPRGLVVSAPVAGGGTTVAFVAAFPGTVIRAATAQVVAGAAVPQPVLALDGGFDPVAVPAQAGDQVRVVLTDSTGTETAVTATVKSGTRPRVVRTSPAPRRTDVPLNAIMRVVFSAPMTLESVREGVRLTQAGARVAAEVAAGDASGVAYDLIPAELLVPATEHAIEIGAVVEDVNGVPLGEAVTAPFTTTSSSIPAAAAHVTLADEYGRIGLELDVPLGYEAALYARAVDDKGSLINSVVAFSSGQPNLVQFSVPEQAGDGWSRVNVRGVSAGRATIVARAGNAVASGSLVVYREIDLSTALAGARVVAAREGWIGGVVHSSDLVQLDGQSELLLTTQRTGVWDRSPMASVNGLLAFERAFMSGRNGLARDSVRIVIRYPDGWEQLVPTGGDQLCPSWSPDGTGLVFTEYYWGTDGRLTTALVVVDQLGTVQSSWPAPAGQSAPCGGWTLDGRNVGLFALPAPDPRPSGMPSVEPSLPALITADSARRFSTFVWSLAEGRWLSTGSGPGVELHDGKRSRDGRWVVVLAGSTNIAIVSRDRTLRAQFSIRDGVPRSPSFAD